MSNTHSFIEFRRHVNQLLANNTLKSQADALAFAIKERQMREVRYRIPDIVGGHNALDNAVYSVFANSLLGPDDYEFFFDSLDRDATRKLIQHLCGIVIEDQFFTNESCIWLQRFLDAAISKEGESHAIRTGVIPLQRSVDFFRRVSGTVEKASENYLSVVKEYYGDEHAPGLFYSTTLSIAEAIHLGCASAENREDYKKLMESEAIANSAREFFPEKKVCITESFKAYAMCYWKIKSALRDNINLNEVDRTVLLARMPILHERVSYYAEKMNAVLGMGVNAALEIYANRNTKEGGSKIPARMSMILKLIKSCDLEPSLLNELGTRHLIKLLNGSLKTLDKAEVKKLIQQLAPIVDWPQAMAALNEKGVELLISSGVDSEYFIDYLNNSDQRRAVLQNDLGM